jgi:hypothetical protein
MAAWCLNQVHNGGMMLARSTQWWHDASLKHPMVAQCLEEAPNGAVIFERSAQWQHNADN